MRRRVAKAVGGLVVAAASIVVATSLLSASSAQPMVRAEVVSVTPTITEVSDPPALPAVSDPPEATPSSATPSPVEAKPKVIAPAVPTSISFKGVTVPAGKTAAPVAPYATVQEGDPIHPPSATDMDLLTAVWLTRHAAPGSQSMGMVYIAGHACAAYPCVFNHLKDLVAGDLVQLKTPNGDLNYQVTDKKRLNKTARFVGDQDSSTYNNELADANQPGRLVLVTCGYAGDSSDSPYNWVVWAQLIPPG